MRQCVLTGITVRLLKRADRGAYLRRFSSQVCQALGNADKCSERVLLQERLAAVFEQRCYVLCCDSAIIGSIHFIKSGVSLPMVYCWLHEHFWSRGLFGRLIRSVCWDVSRVWHSPAIIAHINRSNLRSMWAFYKAGFSHIESSSASYHMIFRSKKNIGL